jgi:hypothetical protein
MPPHLQNVLAVALHPGTCDGEAAAAFHAARRLAARGFLPDSGREVVSFSESRSSPPRTTTICSATHEAIWRVSIRADRLHEFLGLLISKTDAADVRLTLENFVLLGRHVHSATRLEFVLTGSRRSVDTIGGWIASHIGPAAFRLRHPPVPNGVEGWRERAGCAQA